MECRPDKPAFCFWRMVPIQARLSHPGNGDVTPLLKAHDF
jgi:hypothetical protein